LLGFDKVHESEAFRESTFKEDRKPQFAYGWSVKGLVACLRSLSRALRLNNR
jgi:hypothetical protein